MKTKLCSLGLIAFTSSLLPLQGQSAPSAELKIEQQALPQVMASAEGKVILISDGQTEGATSVFEIKDESPGQPKMGRLFIQSTPAGSTGKKAEPSTYLGVSVAVTPPELSEHLPLDKGVGLVVHTIVKDSPAQAAGIKEKDILVKLDDQILIHPSQLSVLVQNRKEGEAVKVSLLRKGTTHELTATLGKSAIADNNPIDVLMVGDHEIELDKAKAGTVVKTWTRVMDGDGPEKKIATIVMEGDKSVESLPSEVQETVRKKIEETKERIRQQQEALRKKIEEHQTTPKQTPPDAK